MSILDHITNASFKMAADGLKDVRFNIKYRIEKEKDSIKKEEFERILHELENIASKLKETKKHFENTITERE